MAQRRRREAAAPQAPVALDQRGQALKELLPSILEGFDLEIGAAVDEVVVTLKPTDLPAACRVFKEHPELDFDYLRCLCVVDYVERLEVNYHLFSYQKRHKMVVKTSASPDDPLVPSIISVWLAADWFEREAHDLFGIVFTDHDNLKPLILYEDFEGYPGRKSYPFHDYQEF